MTDPHVAIIEGRLAAEPQLTTLAMAITETIPAPAPGRRPSAHGGEADYHLEDAAASDALSSDGVTSGSVSRAGGSTMLIQNCGGTGNL